MKGKRKILAGLMAAALVSACGAFPAFAYEASSLVPVGATVGIKMQTDGVTVVGMNQVETESGSVCPASDAGLMAGDTILKIGDRTTKNAGEFLAAVETLDGGSVEVTARRNGKTVSFRVTPVLGGDGAYKLGVWLRDGVSGIGTVTFYDAETGVYGALGHGINDVDSGELAEVGHGVITSSSVVDVVKGVSGKPGELCGQFDESQVLGSVEDNTPFGIFGRCSIDAQRESLPVASEDEVELGSATILSNVSGDKVEEYSVEISRIYRGGNDGRFMMISVTDPRLLEATGGIVQGMSGSPVIQNGKLVGAVTHVLVSDPTRGYGASISSMLDAFDEAA